MNPQIIQEFQKAFGVKSFDGPIKHTILIGYFVENRFKVEMPMDREFRRFRQKLCMARLREKRNCLE